MDSDKQIDELIKSGIKNCNMLRVLSKRIVITEEKNGNCKDGSFDYLNEQYKKVLDNTNQIVNKLLIKGSFFPVKSKLLNLDSQSTEVTMLGSLIDIAYSKKKFDYKSDAFCEELYKYLYAAYLWYIDNGWIQDEYKDMVRDFLCAEMVESDYMKEHFSGNEKKALKVSNPGVEYGPLAGILGEKLCYEQLNNLVNDSNNYEMLIGEDSPEDILEARKIIFRLKFLALNNQLMDWEIYFPFIETPISDFTEEIMTDVINETEYFSNYLDKGEREAKGLRKKLR